MKKTKNIRKVVVAMDSFKGSLSSEQAGNAVAEGIKRANTGYEVQVLPVSDGGDGMMEVWMQAMKGQHIRATVYGPLMEPCHATYGISEDGQTAFIETASACGLSLVPQDKRNPLHTSTYGAGQLIRDALERGCRNFVIGLGGSATNDAGTGMLQALGFRFFDRDSKELCPFHKGEPACAMNGELLPEVAYMDQGNAHPALKDTHFTIACDVQAPFCGPNGAAYVFAPQKGADHQMVKTLDEGLRHMAEAILAATGKDIAQVPGAGAAGGMGGGMLAFLNAELVSGTRLVLDMWDFKTQIKNADFIVTGEGKSDKQTLMGKIPSGILQEAMCQSIPVILLSGGIEDVETLNKGGFSGIFSSTPFPVSMEQAMNPETAWLNLRTAAEQIFRILQFK